MSKVLTTIRPLNWGEDRIEDIKQYIDIVANTNCKYINFNFKYIKYENEKELSDNIAKIQNYMTKKGVSVVITHAPYFDHFYFKNEIGYEDKLQNLICEAIKYSSIIGAKVVVYHAGISFVNDVYNEEKTISDNVAFAMPLAKMAIKYGVKIAVENNVCTNKTSNGEIVEPAPKLLVKVCEEVNHKVGSNVLGICYDIGHINLTNYDMYDNLKQCAEHLFTLHIHNNFGYDASSRYVWANDLHNPIEDGTIDIVKFANELKKCFKGDVVIESKYQNGDELANMIENDYNLLDKILNN